MSTLQCKEYTCGKSAFKISKFKTKDMRKLRKEIP